jgi:hypothetical protein
VDDDCEKLHETLLVHCIKTDVQEIGLVEMDWIDLAHNRDGWRAPVNVLMNLWVP